MKPSWNDSPTWANYLVQDLNGDWIWFEKKPTRNPDIEFWFNTHDSYGRREVYTNPKNPNWTETLEERPKEINNEDN